ncbi:hypothetical protein KAH94_05050 [bacterium]|nr:hypothetical protein [bacterium]
MDKIIPLIEKLIKYGIIIAVLVLLFKIYNTGKDYLQFRKKIETGQVKADIIKDFSKKRKEMKKKTPIEWQKYLNDTIKGIQ